MNLCISQVPNNQIDNLTLYFIAKISVSLHTKSIEGEVLILNLLVEIKFCAGYFVTREVTKLE